MKYSLVLAVAIAIIDYLYLLPQVIAYMLQAPMAMVTRTHNNGLSRSSIQQSPYEKPPSVMLPAEKSQVCATAFLLKQSLADLNMLHVSAPKFNNNRLDRNMRLRFNEINEGNLAHHVQSGSNVPKKMLSWEALTEKSNNVDSDASLAHDVEIQREIALKRPRSKSQSNSGLKELDVISALEKKLEFPLRVPRWTTTTTPPPLISPFERANLEAKARRGGQIYNALITAATGTDANFPSGTFDALVYLTTVSSLERDVTMIFKPFSLEAHNAELAKHQESIRKALPGAAKKIMRKLTRSKEEAGVLSNSLSASDIAKLVALQSIAPLLCRLDRQKFSPVTGECMPIDTLKADIGGSEASSTTSPFSQFAGPEQSSIYRF